MVAWLGDCGAQWAGMTRPVVACGSRPWQGACARQQQREEWRAAPGREKEWEQRRDCFYELAVESGVGKSSSGLASSRSRKSRG